ncbi:MAG: hypothetical protein M1529_07585 [Candidatus Thermoplasmatota archaeon]|jgi:fructose-1,6-bisphosphatase/inositol monophosphatase family enzyme|nr:hypothetical protein [Candidatus Thermoplasmatota archaeon]
MKSYYNNFESIGREAMEALNSMLDRDVRFQVTGMGADGTATKVPDKICEDILIDRVNELDLPFNVVSEEAGIVHRGYEDYILADPLDGTYNALNGIPFYSISMAIMGSDFKSLKTGFIMNLSNGDIYYSEKGKGVQKNGKNRFPSRTGSYIINIGSEMDTFTARILGMGGRRRIMGCASLEMALVATGSADLVSYMSPESKIRNIDIAAGTAMIREAGGEVLDSVHSPINMGLDVTIRDRFYASCDRKILEELR